MQTTVDSIILQDIRICQPAEGFRFGIDSVLLSWFANVKKNDSVIDIGSGSGIISVLLARLKSVAKIDAVELQDEMFHCLKETINLNSLDQIITPIQQDINTYRPNKKYNLAVCNPPYRPLDIGRHSKCSIETNARFNATLTISQLLAFCKKALDFGGRVAFSGDADRFVDMVSLCREYNFEPKRVQFLHHSVNKPAKLFLMESVHGGGVELKVEPPIFQDIDTCVGSFYENILKGDWIK